MLPVMLPFSALLAPIDIVDVVSVEIVVVVYVDVAVAPIAIAPIVRPRCSQYDCCAKCQAGPRHVAWIIIGGIRIKSRRAIDDGGII
jgi:hypothetical protein